MRSVFENEIPQAECSADMARIAGEATVNEHLAGVSSPYDILLSAARLWPDNIAVDYYQDPLGDLTLSWKYADLLKIVHQMACMLTEKCNVTSEDVVATWMPGPMNIPLSYAAETIGIHAPISPPKPPSRPGMPDLPGLPIDMIIKMLKQYQPKVLVTIPPFLMSLKEAGFDLSKIPFIYAEGVESSLRLDEYQKFSERAIPLSQKKKADDVCAVLHTSGTTGFPKSAKITRQSLVYAAWASNVSFPFSADSRVLGTMPFFHVSGQTMLRTAPAVKGGRVIFLSEMGWLDPKVTENFWKLVERHRISIGFGLNVNYENVLKIAETDYDISSLQCLAAGTSLEPSAYARMREILPRPNMMVDLYGFTESGCIVSTTDGDPEVQGSLGVPLPHTHIRLKTDTGYHESDEANVIGEVCVDAPGISPGYFGEPPRAEGEPFETGDVVHSDGLTLRFLHRKHALGNLPVSFPYSLLEVEHLIKEMPLVKDAAVKGERVVSVYVVLQGGALVKDAAKEFSRSFSDRFPNMEMEWVSVEHLARNSLGKVILTTLSMPEIGAYPVVLEGEPVELQRHSICADGVS